MGAVVPFPDRKRQAAVPDPPTDDDARDHDAELYILNLHRRRHPAGSKLPRRRASE